MTHTNMNSDVQVPGAVASTTGAMTRALLACGVVAGPLFVVLALLQVLTRTGFDLRRHPLSMLSLGDMGWIQIANFVITGLLAVACAVGMRRVLRGGLAGMWGPLLVGIYGVGLIAAGVFTADPALGFPDGAAAGVPDELSWHAVVHGLAASLAFLSLTIATFVFIRRFAAARSWGWVAYCAITGVAALALSPLGGDDGISVRLAIGAAVTWTWTSLMARRLMT